jgi:hypothetical protein
MVVSPDEGAISRAMYIASVLGIELGMFYKRRNYSIIIDGKNPIEAHEYLGNDLKGKDVIDNEIAQYALDRLEIDELGLDSTDKRMLETIIKFYDGGPVGLETLAATIGEEAITLEDVYEPYLMQIGYLSRTPRGRCVTRLAYEHLGLTPRSLAREGTQLDIFSDNK